MRRSLPQLVVVAAAMSISVPAFAQSAQNCPPGAWFCADAGVKVQVPTQQVPQVAPQITVPAVEEPQVLPQEPAAPPRVIIRRAPTAQPPVVVYQPVPAAPPTQVIVVTPGYGYGSYGGYGAYGGYARPAPPPMPTVQRVLPPREPRWRSEFGINLRVEGVALGRPQGAAFNAGLGGVGLSLRYRPVPAFAFDLGIDVLAGTDYNGFQRTEIPISLGGMLFLNPKSRVQFYLTGGAHFSRAQVRSDLPAPQLGSVDGGAQYGATYTYFGGQGGGGFEFRLSRRVALDIDCIGFFRKRLNADDGHAHAYGGEGDYAHGHDTQPEFVEVGPTGIPTGRTTNTSAGAIVRGGLTFWW